MFAFFALIYENFASELSAQPNISPGLVEAPVADNRRALST